MEVPLLLLEGTYSPRLPEEGQKTMYEYEDELEYLAANTFVCRCCKKIRNKNKIKKVMGYFTWRTTYVCPDCFRQLNLEERV